jgi:hypothetical protein
VLQRLSRSTCTLSACCWRIPGYEDIYPNSQNCPDVGTAYSAAIHSAEAKDVYQKYSATFETISNIVGSKYVCDDESPLDLYDCIYTHECHGFPLPAGFNQSLVDAAVDMVDELYVVLHSYNNSRYAKAGMALLVNDSLNAMNAVRFMSPSPCVASLECLCRVVR